MADTGIPSTPLPAGWSDAFAALPLEAPPPGGWTRIAAQLPAPPSPWRAPARRRGLAATAAVIAVVVPLAVFHLQRPGPASAPAAQVTAGRSASARVQPTPPRPAADHVAPADAVAVSPRERDAAAVVASLSGPRTRSSATAASGHVRRATSMPTRVEARDVATAGVAPGMPGVASTGSHSADELDRLHRESARLEALVAVARDERVMSAPVAVLASSVDDRIRLIDAALGTAADDEARSALWRQRVDALQELASIEGTQRWLAVHGETLGALTRVD